MRGTFWLIGKIGRFSFLFGRGFRQWKPSTIWYLQTDTQQLFGFSLLQLSQKCSYTKIAAYKSSWYEIDFDWTYFKIYFFNASPSSFGRTISNFWIAEVKIPEKIIQVSIWLFIIIVIQCVSTRFWDLLGHFVFIIVYN